MNLLKKHPHALGLVAGLVVVVIFNAGFQYYKRVSFWNAYEERRAEDKRQHEVDWAATKRELMVTKLKQLILRDPNNEAIEMVRTDIKAYDERAERGQYFPNGQFVGALFFIDRAYSLLLNAHIQLCNEGVPYPSSVDPRVVGMEDPMLPVEPRRADRL